jgi:hypothetical protein
VTAAGGAVTPSLPPEKAVAVEAVPLGGGGDLPLSLLAPTPTPSELATMHRSGKMVALTEHGRHDPNDEDDDLAKFSI